MPQDPRPERPRLTVFDLDHTLLDGDTDMLWCEFLFARGELDRGRFEARNRQMARDYAAGTATAQAFCEFYIATLAGQSAAAWTPLRDAFMAERIAPRLGAAARALVRQHLQAGDLTVLSTATNRFLAEPAAELLGFEHLIATDCACDDAGRFTGGTVGTLNMRDGKVLRLQSWLAARGRRLDDFDSRFYSDSINDLPLLSVVGTAIAVDPEPKLAAEAQRRGWMVLTLRPAASGR